MKVGFFLSCGRLWLVSEMFDEALEERSGIVI